MEIDDLGLNVCMPGLNSLQSKFGAAMCEAHPPLTYGWACSYVIIDQGFYESVCVFEGVAGNT